MRVAVVIIALVIGGWLAFDGTRALTKGDYVTTRAGELGPWSRVVSFLGVDPRSSGMKWAHLGLGAVWLVSAVCFVAKASLGWHALLGCSILTLWYLPLGTVLSIAQIILLLLGNHGPAKRSELTAPADQRPAKVPPIGGGF